MTSTSTVNWSSMVEESGIGAGAGEIMLFGVRVVVDSMRKSVSMNNLCQYECPPEASNKTHNSSCKREDVAADYASADDDVPISGENRERDRKRGVPWTEEEHKLFLIGLQKVGKGDWRGISRNFVKTRTPTQVASHAQKYFLRQSNLHRRRRRSSVFDITTDTVKGTSMEEDVVQHQGPVTQFHPSIPPTLPETCGITGFPIIPIVPIENPMEKLTLAAVNLDKDASLKIFHPLAVESTVPHATAISNLDLSLNSSTEPSALCLNLPSLPNPGDQSSRMNSSFQVIPSFNNSDSIISVA